MVTDHDPYEHGDGDWHLCEDCQEPVETYRLHAACCLHPGDEVERDDDGLDTRWWDCNQCGSIVHPEQSEDGLVWVTSP